VLERQRGVQAPRRGAWTARSVLNVRSASDSEIAKLGRGFAGSRAPRTRPPADANGLASELPRASGLGQGGWFVAEFVRSKAALAVARSCCGDALKVEGRLLQPKNKPAANAETDTAMNP
jgi:hypothetical protein